MHGIDEYLSCSVVFHCKLGSVDESSTDDEQKERILFYYPPDVSISNQLSKLSMLEGLIAEGWRKDVTGREADISC